MFLTLSQSRSVSEIWARKSVFDGRGVGREPSICQDDEFHPSSEAMSDTVLECFLYAMNDSRGPFCVVYRVILSSTDPV